MPNPLFTLLISNQTMFNYLIGIVGVIVALWLTLFCYKRLRQAQFRKLAEKVSVQVSDVQAELNSLLTPTRLVQNQDIDDFKTKHKDLLEAISCLEEHRFYDEDIFEETGIASFKEMMDNINSEVEESNKAYNTIAELAEVSGEIITTYNYLTNPAHYFAYSELEDFIASYDKIKEKVDYVLPKYEEYVSDENILNLSKIAKKVADERIEHNKQFVQSELESNKEYFDKVLGSYPLDSQQRNSIVKLEDNCLVIASAGSGKTSTIVGKAKYLVEKQHVDPSKMLLLTYTKKAANELEERMNVSGLTSSTFHSLAYHIIAETTGMTPSICDADVPLNVFRKLIVNSPEFLHAIDNYILNFQSMMKLEHDYDDAFSYFEDRKKYGIQALFPDADGKIIFTRSEEEKRLCTLLTRFGVLFRYEHPYPIDTRNSTHRQYKPDFTIYYKDDKGEWQRVFLEHFAIDSNGQVPKWFGEGTKNGWHRAQQKYLEDIKWKRETHEFYKTKLIETTSADFWDGTIEEKLKRILQESNVPIKERTDAELYDMLIKRNRQLERTVFTLILSFVTLMKANEKTIEGLLQESEPEEGHLLSWKEKRNRYILTEIIKPFVEAYQEELYKNIEIDFTDAIIEATKLCREGLWKEYDYILVDEFQDISVDRYKLLQALRSEHPKTKLFCVGDDWQSIFRFAGSDMSLFYEFEEYFGFTELCKIETTYRFHQPLIDKSSAFIMKNPSQKPKEIKSPESDSKSTYLNFVKCESEDNSTKLKVEEIVRGLPMNSSIILMGRYNYDILSLGYSGKLQGNERLMTAKVGGRDVPFMSVHSAKGLEADYVILINCNQGAYGFPSLIEDDPILDFVLSKGEQYPFAEERRLFYVAMTRAKKAMYVLYDEKRPSPFIGEFLLKLEVGSYLCPKCLEGKIEKRNEGVAVNGTQFRTFGCSNIESMCDFFETKFGDLTPPGILITEHMTSQDIEKIRQQHRKAKRLGLSVYGANKSSGSGGTRFIPRGGH